MVPKARALAPAAVVLVAGLAACSGGRPLLPGASSAPFAPSAILPAAATIKIDPSKLKLSAGETQTIGVEEKG
jgi:hypothetical protein